jgi:hypothetical protein
MPHFFERSTLIHQLLGSRLDNVFYHSSGQISHPAAPPKRVLLSVQLLHNHKIKFAEILD